MAVVILVFDGQSSRSDLLFSDNSSRSDSEESFIAWMSLFISTSKIAIIILLVI